MKTLRSITALMIALSLFGLRAEVSEGGLEYTTDNVGVGEWINSHYLELKAQADAEHIPLVVFWANPGCAYCKKLEAAMNERDAVTWRKKSGYLFAFALGTATTDNSKAKSFARHGSGEFPYVAFYWNKGAGANTVYVKYSGRSGKMKYKSGTLQQQFMDTADFHFDGYEPPHIYKGGVFSDPDTEGDRLEFESGTQSVKVNLVREDFDPTNVTLVVKGPTGTQLKSQIVEWADGETSKSVEIAITATMRSACATDGKQLTLCLVDAGEVMATNHITYVKRDPSAANPLWLGERKSPYANGVAPNLAFGEWTMDIDLATQVVARASGNAYTLVSIQGSKWCPDCANTDRNFLEAKDGSGNNRFCAWAKAHNVALVSMDVPNYNASGSTADTVASPTLYSKRSFETTLARAKEYPQSGASAALTNAMVRSGLGYLTRKGATDEQAAAVMEKFRKLAVTNTDKGGFHRPEDSNLYRTGVPIFVLLRKDGTVAARFTRFASVSPMAADQENFDNYIKRFEEMLVIAAASGEHADAGEIENNYPGNGAIPLAANGGSATGEICNADFQDAFKLTGFSGNAKQKVTVSGTSDAKVSAQYYQKTSDGTFKTVGASVTGKLSEGFDLTQTFTESGDCYLLVKGANIADPEFIVSNPGSDSFVDFEVRGSTVFVPQEDRATASAPEGSDVVTISLVAGTVYCFSGVTAEDNPFLTQLAELSPFRFLKSSVTGDVELKISSGLGGEISYQVWNPGKIGFVEGGRTVTESVNDLDDDWVEFKIARIGGMSGRVKARVSIDRVQTTQDENRKFEFETNVLDAADFVWEDGVKSNMTARVKIIDDEFFDGDYQIVFKLEVLASDAGDVTVAEGKDTFVLTVVEDDNDTPGRGMISATEPECVKKGMLYVRENEGARIWVERIEACSGLVKAEIASSVPGTTFEMENPRDITNDLGRTYIWWSSREMTKKYVQIGGIPAGKTAKIQLKGVGSFKTVAASNTVTIVSVAEDAPQFTRPSYSFDLYRYLTVGESVTAPLEQTMLEGDDVTFTKLSGTLPAGIKAAYDEVTKSLKFAGTVTAKAGVYTVNYQVVEKRGGGMVPGLTAAITFTVTDPTDVKNDPEHANLSLAKTRTIKDIPVLGQNLLAGVLQLTIPANGRLSAKYLCDSGTIAFSGRNWNDFDPTDKSIKAVLTARQEGYRLEVDVKNDGSVEIAVGDPRFDVDIEAHSDGAAWSKEYSAEKWMGYYTVALPVQTDGVVEDRDGFAPRGSGYITLKMDSASAANKGAVKWAGLLPNGKSVSGSVTLGEPYEVSSESGSEFWAALPVFSRSTTDVLSVFPKIMAEAQAKETRRCVLSEYGEPTWLHVERIDEANAGYSATLGVYGSYYDKNEDLGGCCREYFGQNSLTLAFDVSSLISLDIGDPIGITSVMVDVGERTMTITDGGNPSKVTLSFNRSTGVVTGRANLSYQPMGGGAAKTVGVNYKGVIVTGWGSGCGCGDYDVYLPFVSGSYYLNDKVEYGGDRPRSLSVKRGGAVSLDVD